MRSRNVSGIVRTGVLDIPVVNARLLADWQRELSTHVQLEPGDVEEMPFARARARWPEYRQCMQAMTEWTRAIGLDDALASGDVALMACRGATFHHDGEQYGSAAFCNLFLSDDKGLDLLFPGVDLRIPLIRGTVVLFDTCQPHGVIQRNSAQFNAEDFPPGIDRTQLFLTWELPIEDAHVAQALHITFDTDASRAQKMNDEQVHLNGTRVAVCKRSGDWYPAE